MGMSLYETIMTALENCTDRIKCRDCQWKTCEEEHEVVELPRDLVIAAHDMLKSIWLQQQVPVGAMRDNVTKGRYVFWQYCKDLNDINDAIEQHDENWQDLTSADQIISITYDTSHMNYVVTWRIDADE